MPQWNNAEVQHGDIRGTAALDFHTGGEFAKLAHRLNAKGWPIAIEIRPRLREMGSGNDLAVSVFTVERPESVEKLALDSHMESSPIQATRYDGSMSLEELATFVKRLDIRLKLRPLANSAIEYQEA